MNVTILPGFGVGEFTFDINIYHSDLLEEGYTATKTVKVIITAKPTEEEDKKEDTKTTEDTKTDDTTKPAGGTAAKATAAKTGEANHASTLLLFGISVLAVVAVFKRKRA